MLNILARSMFEATRLPAPVTSPKNRDEVRVSGRKRSGKPENRQPERGAGFETRHNRKIAGVATRRASPSVAG